MPDKAVTYRKGDMVVLTPMARGEVPHHPADPNDPDSSPQYTNLARRLGNGPFKVEEVWPVAPGEVRLAGHHQRLRVSVPGISGMTDQISAAWFQPA